MIYVHTYTYKIYIKKKITNLNVSVIFSVSHTRGNICQRFSVFSVFTFHRVLHILSKHVPHHLRTDLSHVQLLREPAGERQAVLPSYHLYNLLLLLYITLTTGFQVFRGIFWSVLMLKTTISGLNTHLLV